MNKIQSRSERKRAIARANGAKSCGPVSAAGKSRSAQNAVKHGLLSAGIMLQTEHAEAFAALNQNLTLELKPATTTQAILARSFAMCSLRLNRIWDLEAAAQRAEIAKLAAANGVDGTLEAWRRLHTHDPSFTLLRRYEMTFTRELHRTLRHLHELQEKCAERNEPTNGSTPAVSEASTPEAPPIPVPDPVIPTPKNPATPTRENPDLPTRENPDLPTRENPDLPSPTGEGGVSNVLSPPRVQPFPANSPPEIPLDSSGNPAFLAT